ncbi:MAG: response regulator [Acidovorax sp.]
MAVTPGQPPAAAPAITLSRRLLRSMLPWYLLVTVGMLLVQLAIQYVNVSQAIGSDLASLGRTVEPAVTRAVWELDRPQLAAAIAGARQNAIVTGARVESSEGDLLIDSGVAQPPSGPTFLAHGQKTVVALQYALRGEPRQIGVMTLYTHPSVVWNRMKYSFAVVLLNSVIVSGVLWLLFVWTIRYRLSNTLTEVVAAVRHWHLGQAAHDVRLVAYPYADELGELVLALRESRIRQQASMQALGDLNRDLESIVAQRTQELRQAKETAEAATRVKADFLANMSHEIRTPMNAILGMLYLALKDEMAPTLRTRLAKAQGAAQSLLGVINGILDFSKIEAGKLSIEHVEFSLNTVLEQLVDAVSLQAEAKGIELLIRHDPAIPTALVGDPLRLGQVLLNLCGNAVKFTDRGEVELALHCMERSEGQVTLQACVRDTGVGMAPELWQQLFQKFTQADQSTTRRYGGTGLGLAISKNLAELMGGRLWVQDSAPGKGTTMCLSLTLDIAHEAQAQQQELLAQAGPRLRGWRVLVVDDNRVSLEILSEMLRYFQLDVSTASHGAQALTMLRQASGQPYDLVLVDWRMPGLRGDEVAERIHADPAIVHQPKIVMVTAYGSEDVMRLATQAGMDGFLLKPVSPSALLDTMLSVLGHGRPPPAGGGPRAVPAAHGGRLAGARLLLVEDNDINREFAVELLRGEGIEVDEAANGQEAVERVQRQRYDAVLMDIQMPVMDGLEAARRIRALARQPGGERFAALPIIAMTALAMVSDAQASQQAGMNDHVTKPIAPEHLLATLAKWVRVPDARAAQAPDGGAARGGALPADLRALTHLDAADGIRRIGGKAEPYRRQLRRFRAQYEGAVDTLRQLLAAGDEQAASNHCHALKGVTGNLGASALFACISEIDTLLKQGQPPGAALLDAAQARLREVLDDIGALDAGDAPPPGAAALPPEALHGLVRQLRSALETDLGAAEPLLAALRQGVAGTPLQEEAAQIAALVDRFDIDAALARLNTLFLPPANAPR